MKSKQKGSRRRVLLFVRVLLLPGVAAALVIFLLPFVLEMRLKISQDLPEKSVFLHESTAGIGANVALRRQFYWSPDSAASLQTYYETKGAVFLKSGDEYGEWSLTGYRADTLPDMQANFPLGHGALCSRSSAYDCMSLVLVDVTQPQYYLTAAASLTGFRSVAEPEAFKPFSGSGTLIIYGYYVSDL